MQRKGIMPQKRPAVGGEARNRAFFLSNPSRFLRGIIKFDFQFFLFILPIPPNFIL